MKKKLILFMMILFLPIFVKADMGAPMSSYKVRVSKVEGIDTYEWNRNTNRYEPTQEKLSYDTILTIRYENIRDNILFGQAYNNETDKSYEIKLSDVSPVEINLNDYKKETKSKYYVFDDTCYLYKGPSKVYDKISPETSLEVGTIIESQYYDDMWIYIEQNGLKGWVYKFPYGNISPYKESAGMANIDYNNNSKIKTMQEIEMLRSPKTEEKNGVTIPEGTKLEIIYTYSKIPKVSNYYVLYNGTYGWIKQTEEKSVINKDTSIISNIAYLDENEVEITNKNGLTLYLKPNNLDNIITTIPYGTKIQMTYRMHGSYNAGWGQVEYNGNIGWIDLTNSENYRFDSDENNEIINNNQNENNVTPSDEIEVNKENETEKNNPEEHKINNIIIYSIAIALVISLTALVTILLINKTKKSEKNKSTEEKSVK